MVPSRDYNVATINRKEMKKLNLSKNEKKIIRAVAEALPKMSERDQGYFLGYAEAMANKEKEKTVSEDREETPGVLQEV